MHFPILGSTSEDDMTANISSYLMREPTEEECSQFVRERFDHIKNLKAGFASTFVNTANYAFMMDDGC